MTQRRTLMDRVTSATLGRFLRTATVKQVTDLTGAFRRLDLATADSVKWAPGQKVQVQTHGLQLRTFTPFAWTDDTVSLLVYRHASNDATPVDGWLARHDMGSEIAFLGPRGAVRLDNLTAAPIFVGDETSFALSAAREAPAAQVYEVTDIAESTAVLETLALPPAVLVERKPDDAHHDELSAAVVQAVKDNPDCPLVLTGKAQSIKAVRLALKTAGLSPTVRVKTHWDPRRSGLD